jgi:lactoylglutathione lyase
MPLTLDSAFPILYVDDVAASLRFYGELLGFQEMFRFPPDAEPPGYVALTLADGKIALSSAEYAPGHGRPLRPVSGRPFELCLQVDDVDAAVETLLAAGVPLLAQPENRPWGERVAYVEDPDGNPVHIRGPLR